MSVLKVEDLRKKYKNRWILNGINLCIDEGQIITLIGPNGSGKTTLMKAICNLITPDKGEIIINGYESETNYIKYMSQFSCIIENPVFYENQSGYENLIFIASINKSSQEQIDEVISFINLGKAINRKVKEYSLGMKQRLALGMAIIQNPKLIILDEPTIGLDLDAIIQFRKLLMKLKKDKKISVLIATHVISDIESLSDRNLFIKDGILHDVAKLKVKNDIKYLICDLKNNQTTFEEIKKINMIESVEKLENKKIKILVRKDKILNLITSLTSIGVSLEDVEIKNTGLEEIYEQFYFETNIVGN